MKTSSEVLNTFALDSQAKVTRECFIYMLADILNR